MEICILIFLLAFVPGAILDEVNWDDFKLEGGFSQDLETAMCNVLAPLKETNSNETDNIVAYFQNFVKDCKASDCKDKLDSSVTDMAKVAEALSSVGDLSGGLADGFKQLKIRELVISRGTFDLFAKVLEKLPKFLQGGPPLLSLVSLFGTTEEVQVMKLLDQSVFQGFRRATARFDIVEKEIIGLNLLILKKDFWRNIHSDLEKISYAEYLVDDFFSGNPKVQKSRLANLKDQCDFDKLVDAIYAIKDAFEGKHYTQTLCDAVLAYSELDLNELTGVATHLINAVVVGAQRLLIIMKGMGRYEEDITDTETDMVALVKKLGEHVNECAKVVMKDKWVYQWKKDVDKILGFYIVPGHAVELCDEIYDKLSRKYPWRDWLAVAFNHQETTDEYKKSKIYVGETNNSVLYKKHAGQHYEVYIVSAEIIESKVLVNMGDFNLGGVAAVTIQTGWWGVFGNPRTDHTTEEIKRDVLRVLRSEKERFKIMGVIAHKYTSKDTRVGNVISDFQIRSPSFRHYTNFIDNKNQGGVTYAIYRLFVLF